MNESVLIALISGICVAVPSLAATIVLNRKNQALIEYRLTQLEEKVNKHNQIVERTYRLEDRFNMMDDRIKDLEKKS